MTALLIAGCTAADESGDVPRVLEEVESADGDSKADEEIAGLTGGVKVTELAVPEEVEEAFHVLEDKIVPSTRRLVRSFKITAPSGTTRAQRRRSALEAVYAKTAKAGNYSLKKYCATLPTPITTAKPCASKVEATRKNPGAFLEYLEWSTDNAPSESPAAVTVQDYVQARLGSSPTEIDVAVDVGHWEEEEWWSDYHAHRLVMFDPSATKMVVFRFALFGSL